MVKKTRYPFKKSTEWTEDQRDQIKHVAEKEGDSESTVLRRAWKEFYERWIAAQKT